MSRKQKTNRASGAAPDGQTVSRRLVRVGPGRYDLNADALAASVTAYQEKRLARGDRTIHGDGGDFDAAGAVAERDATALLLAHNLAPVLALAAWRECPPDNARNLLALTLPALVEAEILLWHQEIWLAAVGEGGDAPAFRGVPYRQEDLPRRAQYWGFNRDIRPSAEGAAALGLPANFITQNYCLFPLPARSAPRETWPFWMQALGPAGERALLRDEPALLPLAVFIRDMQGVPREEALAMPPEEALPRLRFFRPMPVRQGGLGPYNYLLAALTFLQQEFVEARPLSLGPRPERRRLEAQAGTLPDVRTVAFRKRSSDPAEDPAGHHGPYGCHFLVRSHWRSPHARMKEKRPVFVREGVKGDLTKPFKPPRESVKVVSR